MWIISAPFRLERFEGLDRLAVLRVRSMNGAGLAHLRVALVQKPEPALPAFGFGLFRQRTSRLFA